MSDVVPRDLSHVAPCACTQATAGACPRAPVGVRVDDAMWQRCHDVGRAGALLRWFWDGRPVGAAGAIPLLLPVAAPAPVRAALPVICRHLGHPQGEGLACGSCAGNVRPRYYGCAVYGQTTLAYCTSGLCPDREV